VLLGVPLTRVVRRLRDARDSRYRLLRGYFHGADDVEEGLEEDEHVRLHSIAVEAGSPAVGRRLGDIGLERSGAEVTALRRRGIRGDDPSGDLVLQAGDVFVMRGTPEALLRAEDQLAQP
jgi:CPA2 family monovalent cation:H+ antiporter-2